MTKTIQERSCALFDEAGKEPVIDKTRTEDNRTLFLSVLDSLNNLYEKLSILNYVVDRKIIEYNLHHNKGEGEGEAK